MVLGGLSAGGAEKWVTDFVALEQNGYSYDIIALSSKGQFFYPSCPVYFSETKNPITHFLYLYRFVSAQPSIKVIHCHLNYSNWILCLIGFLLRRKVVAHWHNDTRFKEIASSFFRRLYFFLSRFFISISADSIICVSKNAEASFLKGTLMSLVKDKCSVIFCGTTEFYPRYILPEIELNKKLRVVHFGRFVEQKNHVRVIEIFARIRELSRGSKLYLFGDGPLQSDVRRLANDLGLQADVFFEGNVSNVKEKMYSGADVFLLPSLHEGLPIVCMEAQAVGLPMILSTEVSGEIEHPTLTRFVSLTESNYVWAKAVVDIAHISNSRQSCIEEFSSSIFNLKNGAGSVREHYEG